MSCCAGRQEQQHEPDGGGARRIAQPVEPDVDDRLGGAPLVRLHRRVEDFVARPEQRAAEDRLAAARRDDARQARRDDRAEPADEQRRRRRSSAGAESEPFERQPAQGGLDDEGDEADAGIVEGEEPKQRVAAAQRARRLRAEGVVGQRRARRAERHERREVAQIRQVGQRAQTRARGAAGDNSGASATRRVAAAASIGAARRRTCHALSALITASIGSTAAMPKTAATRSASRPPARPPSVPAAVMPPKLCFADRGLNRSLAISQNPEPRIGTDARDLQVDQARDQGRRGRFEQPLDEKEDRADGERAGTKAAGDRRRRISRWRARTGSSRRTSRRPSRAGK